jgi:hypothetical protein
LAFSSEDELMDIDLERIVREAAESPMPASPERDAAIYAAIARFAPACFAPPSPLPPITSSIDAAVKLLPPGWHGATDTQGYAWVWRADGSERWDICIPDAPAAALACCAVVAWGVHSGRYVTPGTVRWDVRAFNSAFSTACRKNDAKAMYVALVPLVGGKEGQFSVVTGGDAQACQLVEHYLRAGGMQV